MKGNLTKPNRSQLSFFDEFQNRVNDLFDTVWKRDDNLLSQVNF